MDWLGIFKYNCRLWGHVQTSICLMWLWLWRWWWLWQNEWAAWCGYGCDYGGDCDRMSGLHGVTMVVTMVVTVTEWVGCTVWLWLWRWWWLWQNEWAARCDYGCDDGGDCDRMSGLHGVTMALMMVVTVTEWVGCMVWLWLWWWWWLWQNEWAAWCDRGFHSWSMIWYYRHPQTIKQLSA